MEFRRRNLSRTRRVFSFSRKLVLLFLVCIIAPVLAWMILTGLNSNSVEANTYGEYDWSKDPNWLLDSYVASGGSWQTGSAPYKLWGKLDSNYKTDSLSNTGNIYNLEPSSYYSDSSRFNSVAQNKLETQNPFLFVGTDGKHGSLYGFNKMEMYLDFWIPDGNNLDDYTLDVYDICHSFLDVGTQDGERITIAIHGAGSSKIKPLDSNVGAGVQCNDSNIQKSFELPRAMNGFETKELQNKQDIIDGNNPTTKRYKKYTILVQLDRRSLALKQNNQGRLVPSSYYNYFRLRIRPDSVSPNLNSDRIDVYLTPATTQHDEDLKTFHNYLDPDRSQTSSERFLGLSEDDNFGMIVGNAINLPYGTNAQRMMLYETNFIVAPDIEKYECSNTAVGAYVGIYNTDRLLDARLDGYPPYKRQHGIEIKADIHSVDRDVYSNSPNNNSIFTKEATLTFNGKLDNNDLSQGVIQERSSVAALENLNGKYLFSLWRRW